jgi:hypothetical protein
MSFKNWLFVVGLSVIVWIITLVLYIVATV